MLPIKRKFRIIIKGLIWIIISWFLLQIMCLVFPPLNSLFELNESFFFKMFFRYTLTRTIDLKARQSLFNKLIIIDSLDPTEERSRADYAELINLLRQADAAVIGIDIRFIKHNIPGSEDLVDAVKNFPRTILPISFAQKMEMDAVYTKGNEYLQNNIALAENSFLFTKKQNFIEFPFINLLESTRYLGHVNFKPTIPHLFPLVIECDNLLYPAFPFTIAQAYHKHKGKELNIKNVPVYKHAQMIVKFVPSAKFKYFIFENARSLLRSNDSSLFNTFKDKIILIVNSSPEIPFIDTPLGQGSYPRWAYLASMVCQLLDDSSLRAPWYGSLLLAGFLLFVGLAWLLFFSERYSKRWQKLRWPIIFGILIFFIFSYFMIYFDYWIEVISPIFIFAFSLFVIRVDLKNIYQVPEYKDFLLTVTEEQNRNYPVSISYSPAGEEEEKVIFPMFFTKKSFVETQGKLCGLVAEQHDIREFGKQLYKALFQGSIENRLMHSISLIKNDKENLRIRLRLDAPEISRLPWEYMYSDSLPTGFVALNRDISITRYIPFASFSNPATEFRAPLRILVAIASPKNYPMLNIEREKKSIKKSLSILTHLRQVKISFFENATFKRLANEIEYGNYHVLHFIGHGAFDKKKGEGLLLLEDDNSFSNAIGAETIGLILNESSIRMAVLNCCEGAMASGENLFFGIAQKLVRVGVPAVVAMQHSIIDDTAIIFSREFYSSFIFHFSIDKAVSDARFAILKEFGLDRQDWGTPVLFLRAYSEIFSHSPIEL